MSDERRHPDDVTDPIVSSAYRELSTERTPEHLDHIVLNEARNAAKQRHRSAMAWLRPAAWVTTIGLCLAIVLEIADLQEQDAFDDAVTDEKEVMQAPVTEALPSSVPAEAKTDDAAIVGDLEAPALRKQSVRDDLPAAIEVDADADRQFLHEAESRARLHAGSDERAEEVIVTGVSALGIASDLAAESYCSDEQRADPNEWLACILELEGRSMPEAAMLERSLLREAFPDFYVPPELPGQTGKEAD